MEIPPCLDKSPISYGWDGNDEVWVFTSRESLPAFRKHFAATELTVEKLMEDDESLNYLLKDGDGIPAFQFLVAMIDSEHESDFDIMSYVGEREFNALSRDGAALLGAYFKLSSPAKEANKSVQATRD
jgi:hypothetical protein